MLLLAEDAMKSLLLSKPKVVSALALFVGLLGIGVGNLLFPAAAGQTGLAGVGGLPAGQGEKAGKKARPEQGAGRKAKDQFGAVIDLELKNVALQDAIEDLSGRLPINMIVDRNDLKEKQIPLDMPINLRLRKVPFKTALKHLLRQADLGYTIEDDVLIIASAETARGKMVRKVYPVADLVGDGQGDLVPQGQPGGGIGVGPGGAGLGALGGKAGAAPGGGGFGAMGQFGGGGLGGGMGALGGALGQFGGGMGMMGGGMGFQGGMGGGQQWLHLGEHQLIQVITRTVGPTTWAEMGGPGSIAYLPRGGSLVVSQCSEIQDQIQTLIEELRAAKKQQEEKGMLNAEGPQG
jgi:hypothetical protein